jgi:hypothetical protein
MKTGIARPVCTFHSTMQNVYSSHFIRFFLGGFDSKKINVLPNFLIPISRETRLHCRRIDGVGA